MRKLILILASAVTLAAWTTFGYHEGLKQVPKVQSVDKDIKSIAGKQLYCFNLFGGIEPCVVVDHSPNGKQVLLVPEGMLKPDPDEQAPKENSPQQN